jgi:hypothetical protein
MNVEDLFSQINMNKMDSYIDIHKSIDKNVNKVCEHKYM